jgi:hypothetical protein
MGRARIRAWRMTGSRHQVDIEFEIAEEGPLVQDITFPESP